MDQSLVHQCDNTNSIKYIIDHEEYSLLKTRNFSQDDLEEFLIYSPSGLLEYLSETTMKALIYYAETRPIKINGGLLDALFERGLNLGYYAAEIFASNNMDGHLEEVLSKLCLTQIQYIKLWHETAKCKDIIAIYFNSEACDILYNEYKKEKKENIFNNTFYGSFLMFFILITIVPFITGIVFLSTADESLHTAGIIFLGIYPLVILMDILWIILYACMVHDGIKTLRKYKKVLDNDFPQI